MDVSTSPMMAFSIHLAFPVLSGTQALTAFSVNALLWTFLVFTGISLVVKEPHRPCQDVQILQGVLGRRAVTGKASLYPLSLFACQGKITYHEITLAKDSTLSKWLEYSFSTNTHEGMQLTEKKSEGFHLTVVARSEACEIPTANVTLHSEDRICIHAKNIICSGGWHANHISITFAEIVLRMEDILEIKEQLDLICTMAEYLYLDPSSLTLIPVEDSLNKYFQNLTVLAEDIRYINSTKGHRVGLCWPVGFGVFAMLPELIRVLSHNVESDNLSQLLGYEIVGWRVLKQGYEKRNPNKWQKRKMATPKPTWRPTQTQNFIVLVAAVPETHSVVKSEMSSSLVNKATFSVIHPYVDLSTWPEMVHMNLETPQVSKSTMFHYLSSELSPSLMLSTTEFEEKGAFQTPPISEHLLYEALLDTSTQEDFPATQKSEPKDSSTLYYLNLFMPFTKSHFSNSVHHPRDILPEEMSSTSSSSPKLFSGELRNLNDHSPFVHRTTSGFKSGEIISIIELSLPSMVTLAYLRTSLSSSELSFSSVAISLLFLHDSYQNPKLFNVDSSASDTFMTLAPMKETDVSQWIKSSILTNIPSIFDAIITNGDFDPKSSSPSSACPPTRLYYCSKDPTSSKHSMDTLDNSTSFFSISLLTFSFLSKTISNPVIFPSFSSVPAELTLLFGSSNIFPMEKLPDRRQVSSDGMNACESSATIPLSYRFVTTGSSVLVFMKTEMDTSSLWIKETTLFSSVTSSAVILSSRFLSQGERPHRKTQALELLPCGSSWITPRLEFIHASSFHFSTYQCDSIHNLIRTPVKNHDTLQLETNGLSLESSFGTKTNVQIARDIVSTLKEPAIVFSRKGISTENGVHATTTYQKTQDQPNTPPRVIHAIKWIAATVGYEFSFSIPPETFHDQEDGNSSQLTLGMNPVDGSPTDLESWLQFNARDKRMYGYPLDADFQYSPQEFSLFAIDSGGLKTEDKFVVEIFKPTIIPCHVYTVIARDSYHSFLTNRKRIYFFLKKLSDYLLVESPGDVVLLHLKTGSAVFTWYNKSFCPKAEKCARDDIQDVLTKLGRPGQDVHPDFAEAMLPEFKIEQIGEVGYGGMCLSTTKPTNDSVVFNRTVTGFDGSNCWITNVLMALLVAVCCTILAFLITVHCQKYRKKTFQPECSPSCGHIDFKMGTQTSRKSPLLEQDVPPSTRLPIPVPMVCQQPSLRPHRGLVISRLPSPPKYRLPPLYERRDPG